MSDEDRVLAAWSVTREDIEALNNDRGFGEAHRQAKQQQEALVEGYTAGMAEIASRLGLTLKTEPILRGDADRWKPPHLRA
jgi:hypothetical protein